MTWIAGTGRAGYDHCGEYVRIHEVSVSVPAGLVGDPSSLGIGQLGTYDLCGEVVPVEIRVTSPR